MVQSLEEKVQHLLDHQAIERLVHLYCRAIDRLDVDLLRSIYHPDATDEHGVFIGNAHEFASFIMQKLAAVTTYGFHTITQSIIDIRGDVAAGESTYLAYHRIGAGFENIARFFGETYARRAEKAGTIDIEHEFVAGGRYIDRFERREGVWRIARRKITNEWQQCQPITRVLDEGEPGHVNLPGARDRTDPVYGNLLD